MARETSGIVVLPIAEQQNDTRIPLISTSTQSRWGRTWQWVKSKSHFNRRAIRDRWLNSRFGNVMEKYSDLMNSVTILALDIIFLAGKVLPFIPSNASKSSFVALNFIGLISINFSASFMIKAIGDAKLSLRLRNIKMLADASVNTTRFGSSIVLVTVDTIAAIASLTHHNNLTRNIYNVTRPVGVAAVIIGLSLETFRYITNKPILRYLNEGLSHNEMTQIVTLYKTPRTARQKNSKAADIRTRMDKDTWRCFKREIKQLPCEDYEALTNAFHAAHKNIETQQFVAKAYIGLRIVGDTVMTLSDLFPGTVIQAGADTSISALYTTILVIRKIRQARERDEIKEPQTSAT